MQRFPIVFALVAAALAGCSSEPDTNAPAGDHHRKAPNSPQTQNSPSASVAAGISEINQAVPTSAPSSEPTGQASQDSKSAAGEPPMVPSIVRAQVLLARVHFSSGVVDGQLGTNFKHAVSAYQGVRNLAVTGEIDDATWKALSSEPAANRPAAINYTITASDTAGPFAPDVGEDFVKLAALPGGPQFASPFEALAERFHMSQALLKALNPNANFAAAGQQLIVVDAEAPAFAKGDVARIDVTKSNASVDAYDDNGTIIAFYPATVGSTERPSPSGIHKVVGVAWNPNYTYDPAKLAWGPRSAGKLLIKPGPDNPVGTVWIDLNAPGYGIHGTPEPDKIGKTASHGCVRLTNWDAHALAAGVKPGVVVRFSGARRRPAA